jgi:nucleoside-diphosphate-sugar epimerase
MTSGHGSAVVFPVEPIYIFACFSKPVKQSAPDCEIITLIVSSDRSHSMRIMITGGTGFIGYHTARKLMAAGHEVRLLVRSENKLRRLYGEDVQDFVTGDVTDADTVGRALRGCDGVVHTAAMVSVNKKDAELVHNTNVGGTRLVIGGAVEQGLAKIIHVSSVTALYDPKAAFLNEFSAPGAASNAYGKSKVECEVYVRGLQDAGAPIHITYPASVIGPDDPALTEPHQGLITYLANTVPVLPSGNQWVDARDIAEAHLQLLERTLVPGRYTLGGHFVPWTELVDILGRLRGRKVRKIPIPGNLMRGVGKLVDWYNAVRDKPLDAPITYEAMTYATHWVKMDSSKARAELGLEFMPLEQSLVDAIRSLVAAGHIDAEQAGNICD